MFQIRVCVAEPLAHRQQLIAHLNIWGIGLEQNHADAADAHKWQGFNLLGFALMEVRNMLRK